ncbi:hypothetical protein HAX54_009911 [Datura stramonium]|uniref:Neprosin PEP catalytic domain-containing protein n=1 Tax=Datura stramonium TaxID=4076 RepID=A0ABS8RX78_DATST|nr:hypothetical protein [Datura stramonium]
MKPYLSRIKQNVDASTTSRSLALWPKGRGCPSGTVPVRRITKSDLIRQRDMPPPENINFDDQFVGVDPTLYGNNMTRLFIHFQAGKTQCFNALCPGFVQVSSTIPLDMSYEGHLSQRGVTVWGDTMYIERDLINGNWWVLMEEDYEKVGFWPQGIFSDLKSFGTNVEWGGVAYSPPNIAKPPMGSSFLPSGYVLYDGYCRSIAVINEKGETVEIHKTKYGDIYDCVDFYKQPAFDHPSLKDHNFHPKMKPNLFQIDQNSSGSTSSRSSTLWSENEGCPSGTVPIRRITKNDLIRHKHMPPPENVTFDTQFSASNNNSEPKGITYMSSQGYKVAIVRTPYDPFIQFAGAGMIASVYNPHVKGHQHSACRLKIQTRSDILQVGWRVDPTLYGDTKTRLFIHFQAGKIQCFNTLCPGFVQVNSEMPPDISYEDHVSHRGGPIWEDTMYIERDLVNGNWWLLMEDNYTQIGFWPQKLFTGLAGFATTVEWGGVVYSPQDVAEPPMGSSFFPIGQSNYDAYCKKIAILNVRQQTIEVDKTIPHTDNPNMYKVLFEPLWFHSKPSFFVLYGGPGDYAQV